MGQAAADQQKGQVGAQSAILSEGLCGFITNHVCRRCDDHQDKGGGTGTCWGPSYRQFS
jgi:hypothetical protein